VVSAIVGYYVSPRLGVTLCLVCFGARVAELSLLFGVETPKSGSIFRPLILRACSDCAAAVLPSDGRW
jgi:hypothetical protein